MPGGVHDILQRLSPPGRTMAMESTQPLTQTSTGQYVALRLVPLSCADYMKTLGAPNYCSPRGLSRRVKGKTYLLITVI
jgi:hypothetical protein